MTESDRPAAVPSIYDTPGIRQIRIIVELRSYDISDISNIVDHVMRAAGEGAVVYRTFAKLRYLVLSINSDRRSAIEQVDGVVRVTVDQPYRSSLQDSTQLVGAVDLWQSGLDGQGYAVAVLDTGVDRDHPFLSGKVIAEACFSGEPGSDPNLGPATLCANGSMTQFGVGAADPKNMPNCRDEFGTNVCSHGTHVAGIAAGNDPGRAIYGVARGADVIAVQVFHRLQGDLWVWWSDVAMALWWLHDLVVNDDLGGRNLASVNMSFECITCRSDTHCDDNVLKPAIDALLDVGVVTTIAAGNSGWNGAVAAPACISSAVTVAAVDKFDFPADFSNFASIVDVWAPGVDILSSIVGGQYQTGSGTSMAAPHVAGAAALLEQSGISGGRNVSAALTKSNRIICRAGVCKPRLSLTRAQLDFPEISGQLAREITSSTAFIKFISNVCGYADYSFSGGAFSEPRTFGCLNSHTVMLGVDTPPLAPGTAYTIDLTLTDPSTGYTDSETVSFTTLNDVTSPTISQQQVTLIASTSAYVSFQSSVCGYADYRYAGNSTIADRSGPCFSKHGVTLGVDTQPLNPGSDYTVDISITDAQTGAIGNTQVSFTTLPLNTDAPRITSTQVNSVTTSSAFVGFTSNVCTYGDYRYQGGQGVAPRGGRCDVEHSITIGVDTPALNPGSHYSVDLVVTHPTTGATAVSNVQFNTQGQRISPSISEPFVRDITQTTAFIGFNSSVCGYGAISYEGTTYSETRDDVCARIHGLTLGIDTPPLVPNTSYAISLTLTDPITGETIVAGISFTTLENDGSTNTRPMLVTTEDKQTSGYAWFIDSSDEKQWVNAQCRVTLQQAGMSITTMSWNRIARYPNTIAFVSCDKLIDSRSSRVSIVTTPDKRDNGYAWVQYPDNTKQWINESCRKQLVDSGIPVALSEWNEISSHTDRESPLSCDALLSFNTTR